MTSILEHFRTFAGHDYRDFCGEGAGRIRASIASSTYSSSWGNTLGRATRAYFSANEYAWRELVRVKPLKDFREQTMIHFGGYKDVAIVAERDPYPAADTPTERAETYSPETRGATEDWSRKAMLNDDVRILQSIPRRLGIACARTLYKFVTSKLTIAGQPTMSYDSVALFHAATHGNLKAGAYDLDADEIAASAVAMLALTDFYSGEELGIQPALVLFPTARIKDASDALKSLQFDPGGATSDRSFVVELGLKPHRVPTWTNAKDWVLAVGPDSELCFELGFVNGQEEPELFVNDNDSLGTMFDRDVAVVKVRHEYGGGFPSHQGYLAHDVS
jgi:hypothetical protein